LLQVFPAVFDALRLAGAAYLAYLGVKSWRAPVDTPSDLTPHVASPAASAAKLFRLGAGVAASNPKALLFAVAFLPQFIHPNAPKLPQFAILLVSFAVIEISWYFVYAVSGKRMSVYLQRAPVLRAFNRLTGAAFIGFAALMAVAKN
jgi:threonine/homoserine/homoserine lactone efflux protein